ncbi:MAG: Gfo/Idh/MocA family protein [Limisphaerales bacterium]
MKLSRRQFIRSTAATAVVAPNIIPSGAWANKPSERINLGFIGFGRMNSSHLNFFLGQADCRVASIAEVAKVRLDEAVKRVAGRYGEKHGCKSTVDFRDILNDKSVDAVVIGTPDHWHAMPAIMAADAKKDIYCEKPLTVTVRAALETLKAARRNNIVFQVGSQQRTEYGGKFRQAVECVRNGRIGEVKKVKIGIGAPAVRCDLPTEAKPDGIDWEMWLGPAPERGFNKILCPIEMHKHFPQWRRYREYAGGGLSDMGAHHFDIAKWAMDLDETIPVKVIPPKKGSSGLRMIYENGVEFVHETTGDKFNDCVFYGSEGTLYVDRRGIDANPKTAITSPFDKDAWRLPEIGNSHRRNWIDCIRSRKKPVADVSYGAHTSMLCSMANIGYEVRYELRWNTKSYRCSGKLGGALANRPGRGEWKFI